ncbi:MAG: carbohydrate ABC transporter permease [Chloroflexi bacterium]|nr:carbohydrate ABC transporter permease [Anaerolineaceae bacterium]NMB89579.1 carbohydrate ABC transporter permease [Chloroflexota bacterium]
MNRTRHHLSQALIYLILIAGALWSLFPFVWMVLSSLKGYVEASAAASLLPKNWLWSNYVEAWNQVDIFPRYFFNTILIATMTVLGVLITSSLASYAFASMRFPGREVLFFVLLSTMMVPFEVTLVPNFIMIRRLGWIDHYQAMIIPWAASAFSIFLLRQFFRAIPSDLRDAAVIDGCTHLRYLWSIVLPLSKPALVTSALFTFLGSWNSLMWPLLVTNDPLLRPIQVGIAAFIKDAGTQVQLLMAAVTISVIPVILIYLLLQRWFIEGIATVGIRG